MIFYFLKSTASATRGSPSAVSPSARTCALKSVINCPRSGHELPKTAPCGSLLSPGSGRAWYSNMSDCLVRRTARLLYSSSAPPLLSAGFFAEHHSSPCWPQAGTCALRRLEPHRAALALWARSVARSGIFYGHKIMGTSALGCVNI